MANKRKRKQIANTTLVVPLAMSVLVQGFPFGENEFLHKQEEANSVFSGGDGHTIRGLTINQSIVYYAG